MSKALCIVLVVAMAAMVSCQLFNDLSPPRKGGNKFGGFEKTINFDNIKLSDRPKANNNYLPPDPPEYLPPKPSDKKEVTARPSTRGATYLPPITSPRTTIRPISYMPPMGTFPPVKYYTYSTTYGTTRKPMPPPRTLPPLTTTRKPTTGYSYDKPVQVFVEGQI